MLNTADYYDPVGTVVNSQSVKINFLASRYCEIGCTLPGLGSLCAAAMQERRWCKNSLDIYVPSKSINAIKFSDSVLVVAHSIQFSSSSISGISFNSVMSNPAGKSPMGKSAIGCLSFSFWMAAQSSTLLCLCLPKWSSPHTKHPFTPWIQKGFKRGYLPFPWYCRELIPEEPVPLAPYGIIDRVAAPP